MEWAERNRVLTHTSNRVGPFRWSATPHTRAIVKIANTPGVAQLNIMKSSQGGGSESLRSLIGYWAAHAPDPTALALPNRTKGEQIFDNNIKPLFRDTPSLAALMTGRAHDITNDEIKLANGFRLALAWAGSSASAKSDPFRRVINDEVEEFEAFTGNAHMVDLMRMRLRTYGDRAVEVNISTPGSPMGKMAQLFEGSDYKLYFLVECPGCRSRIRLIWPQLKFRHYEPKEPTNRAWAARILREDAAWYECQVCGHCIDERTKRRIVQDGWYGTVDENGVSDGVIVDAESIEEWPRRTKLSLHFSALYYLWTRFSDIAAEFIDAQGDLSKTIIFHTDTLGEPFQQRIAATDNSVFSRKSQEARLPEGIVPWWAAVLIAVIDTQAAGMNWMVIRAWGPGMRSQRIFHGEVPDAELDRWCWGNPWRVENDLFPPMICGLVLRDSGGGREEGMTASRTMEVYRWCLERSAHVRAIKGDNKPRPGLFIRRGQGWLRTGDRVKRGDPVPLWLLDVHHFQDELADMISRELASTSEDGETISEDAWSLNQRDDPIYNAHMAALIKTAVREGSNLAEKWAPFQQGARHDLRDCEGYQVAAAYMANVHLLPDLETFRQMKINEFKQSSRSTEAREDDRQHIVGITTPDGRPFGWW